MADNNAAKAPEAEGKKEEKKQPTALEGVVNESWNAVKASTNAIVGSGAIAGATALFGLDGLVTAASFPIGAKISYGLAGNEFKSKNFRDEAIASALFTPPLWFGVEAVKQVPKAFGIDDIVTADILGSAVSISPTVAGLAFGVLMPALTALYYPLQYVIQNKTFKGIGKDFKDNYGKVLKKPSFWLVTAAASAAIGIFYATSFLTPFLYPTLGVINPIYRAVLSPEKIEYKKLFYPSTYLPNFINPVYLVQGAGSLVGRGYSAAYRFGSGITNFFKSMATAAKPASAPAPTPVPATAPAAQPA